MPVGLSLGLLGVAVGTVSALLGIGGGILIVPALTLLFNLPIRVAVGASLVGILASSSGVAVMAPKGRGANVSLALRLEVATTAGALAGSYLAGLVSERMISLAFALVTLLTAFYVWQKSRHARTPASDEMYTERYEPHHWAAGLGMAGFAGTLAGLLGVSGGFIKVPVMHSLMEVPLGIANATSSFMVGLTAAASIFVYYGRGDIHPLVAIPLAAGVFLGALVGVSLLPRVRAGWLRMALVGLLLVVSVQMFLRGVQL